MGHGTTLRVVLGAALALGCQNEATRRCHAVMTSAQELVKNVDSKDVASVEASLAAVVGAIDACTTAQRQSEVDALTRAKNELAAHADYLKQKAARGTRPKQTPEELAALFTKGDSNCPKGQAYKPDPNGKEIRCTGPQIVDMSLAKAREYFDRRGFKLVSGESPPSLTAEYGAEKYVFTYGAATDEHPRCLTLYPVPGIPFQEATARVTGVLMKKIEKDGELALPRGKVPIHTEESETKLVIRIGDCG